MSVCAVHDSFSIPYEAVKRELADYYIHDYREIWNETYEICGE
jgi:16S rRNA pseudouridine516 synthase